MVPMRRDRSRPRSLDACCRAARLRSGDGAQLSAPVGYLCYCLRCRPRQVSPRSLPFGRGCKQRSERGEESGPVGSFGAQTATPGAGRRGSMRRTGAHTIPKVINCASAYKTVCPALRKHLKNIIITPWFVSTQKDENDFLVG